MGGVCSAGARLRDSEVYPRSPGNPNCIGTKKVSISYSSDSDSDIYIQKNPRKFDCIDVVSCSPFDFKPPKQVKTTATKVPPKGSPSGRPGVVPIEFVDANRRTPRYSSSTYIPGISRGSEVSIFSFEIASTISKAENVLRSLSEDNIQFLKERILLSDGVQRLVSTDMEELLIIAAADKREEFELLAREVVRFGNLCKDQRWHNLDHHFKKLGSDAYKISKEEADKKMEELATLAKNTSDLYRRLRELEKAEQEYHQKLEEVESQQLPGRGDSLKMVQIELTNQRRRIKELQQISLWSKIFEEVVEKLVDAATLIHHEISEAFGNKGNTLVLKEPNHSPQRLGASGLALHYAKIIKQIETISLLVSRPYSLPPNTRDSLYHGLPPAVKKALRSHLQSSNSNELTELQIRTEMEKTLRWLVPLAEITIKAHQGFGSVGEWATSCNTFYKEASVQNNSGRLQTLYHADREKMDLHILELVTWLHHLMNQMRQRYYGFKPLVPVRSPKPKSGLVLQIQQEPSNAEPSSRTGKSLQLPKADQDLLEDVSSNPGTSKSEELSTGQREGKQLSLSRSNGRISNPTTELSVTQNLENTRTTKMLDSIDRFDETTP